MSKDYNGWKNYEAMREIESEVKGIAVVAGVAIVLTGAVFFLLGIGAGRDIERDVGHTEVTEEGMEWQLVDHSGYHVLPAVDGTCNILVKEVE